MSIPQILISFYYSLYILLTNFVRFSVCLREELLIDFVKKTKQWNKCVLFFFLFKSVYLNLFEYVDIDVISFYLGPNVGL